MSDFRNSLQLFAGKRRWIKRYVPSRWLGLAYVPLPGGRRVFADAADYRGPSFHVIYGGAAGFENYEKPEKDLLLEQLPEAGVFLDIGANIGLFALYAHWARPRAEIHAFEPHPRNLDCLRLSCQGEVAGRVHAHGQAVGDESGELDLFFDESDAGGHSAYRETLSNNRSHARSVRVPVTTIDDFVRARGLARVDVVKIDTQGGEAAALRGARETLRRFRPALLIECDFRHLLHASAAGSILRELAESQVSYQAIAVGDAARARIELQNLEALARIELERGVFQRNFLFVARPLV